MILDGFESVEHIKTEYNITYNDLQGYNILVATFNPGNYNGSSVVIMEKEGKLYIVDVGYCDHYYLHRLDGSWKPYETTLEILMKTAAIKKATGGYSTFVSAVEMLVGMIPPELVK